jgi:RNA polymerase sigma-70 factor, ECF subfamily
MTVKGMPQSVDRQSCERLDWSSLTARAQSGDRDAYRRLLIEIAPWLNKLAVRHHLAGADAEDVVQDALMTVHLVRHTYDPARPFAPWLAASAQRRMIDGLRRRGRSRARETTLETRHETFEDPRANIEESGLGEEVLREAVAQLLARQRQALRILKLQELSLKEASARTGMSIVSLKVATRRGLKALRKVLQGK